MTAEERLKALVARIDDRTLKLTMAGVAIVNLTAKVKAGLPK